MVRMIFCVVTGLVLATAICPVRDVGAAEKYTIKEMTPQVTAALENRRDRFASLQQLKRQGDVGENAQGYVEALSGNSKAKVIVDLENADHAVIYKTIAQQNNLSNALSIIEQIFAQTQRDNAEPGNKIQLENGSWGVK